MKVQQQIKTNETVRSAREDAAEVNRLQALVFRWNQIKGSEFIHELLDIAKFMLEFLPWFLFLVLPTDGWEALRTTVAICLFASIVLPWQALRKGFILPWATLGFFLFSTISLFGFRWVWLAEHMGIIATGFLDGVIWFTVLAGKPFTLQYARADLPQERWYDEGLIRGSELIAIFWGTLLFIPTVFSAFQLAYPTAMPSRFYFYLTLFCIIVGICYTTFYKHKKRKQRQAL